MGRYYEITDGDLHVGWASEDYMFTKMDERVLKGEANFNFHVGDRDAVDVVPVKHGHWIFGETMGHSWMKCSECCKSQSGQTLTFTYCPNCGAKMDGGKDDE